MSEPRFANYLQLHVPKTHHKWKLISIIKHAGYDLKFSNGIQSNTYCMINLKRKNCVWNSIKTETKVKIIDDAFMEQLEFLEIVGMDAQAEYLLDPV